MARRSTRLLVPVVAFDGPGDILLEDLQAILDGFHGFQGCLARAGICEAGGFPLVALQAGPQPAGEFSPYIATLSFYLVETIC